MVLPLIFWFFPFSASNSALVADQEPSFVLLHDFYFPHDDCSYSYHRRSTPGKAWTQGTNPIAQRQSNLNQQNGATVPSKTAASKTAISMSKEINNPDKHAHDRMIFLLAH